MAIARDNFLPDTTIIGFTSSTTPYTITGLKTALFVSIVHFSPVTVVSVTYNGVALTAIDQNIVGETTTRLSSFLLVGTATGTNNIVITMSGTATYNILASSYTGVGVGADIGGSDGHTGLSFPSTTIDTTITTTTVSDNAWIVNASRTQQIHTAGTNLNFQLSTGGVRTLGDTNGPITPAGATNQVYVKTNSIPAVGALVSVALKPFVPVTTDRVILF